MCNNSAANRFPGPLGDVLCKASPHATPMQAGNSRSRPTERRAPQNWVKTARPCTFRSVFEEHPNVANR